MLVCVLGRFWFLVSPQPLDDKVSDLKLSQFKVVVILSSLGDSMVSRYPCLGLHSKRWGNLYFQHAYICGTAFSSLHRFGRAMQVRYYHVALTQQVPNTLQMWVGFRIMCTFHGWTHSLPLFWCFYRFVVGVNHYHYFQHR